MLIVTLSEAIVLGFVACCVAALFGMKFLVFVLTIPDWWREWRCKHDWRDARATQKFASGTTISYPVRRCDKCEKEKRR